MIYMFAIVFSNYYVKFKNEYENINYDESDEF